jgi:hypothetical protein
MRKIFKMAAIAFSLVLILVVSIASVAFAAGGPNPDRGSGTCPNPECTDECPNPDGICDGDQLQCQSRNGAQTSNGTGFLYRYGNGLQTCDGTILQQQGQNRLQTSNGTALNYQFRHGRLTE